MELAYGIDHRQVKPSRERKSYSRERTFDHDLSHTECYPALKKIYLECKKKLLSYLEKNRSYQIKTTIVKVKFADFSSTTVECSDLNFQESVVLDLLEKALNRNDLRVRLLGCGVKFSKNDQSQLQLF